MTSWTAGGVFNDHSAARQLQVTLVDGGLQVTRQAAVSPVSYWYKAHKLGQHGGCVFAAAVEHTAAVFNLPAGPVMCSSSEQDPSRNTEGSCGAVLKMTRGLKVSGIRSETTTAQEPFCK